MQAQQQVDKPIVAPILSPYAAIVSHLQKKCNLAADQIEQKLMNGDSFDMIRGEGNDIDTKLMEEVLNENEFYERPSQKNLKDETMRFLKGAVEQWSVEIAKNQMRINQDEILNYTAKLLPFGSYLLDLRSNSSDIDLICVCPNFIQRETHFFGNLAQRLYSQPEVKHLATRTNARVPIITFEYKDIQIDISYCQLNRETIPGDIEKVISNELLASITDERSKISLLGRKNNLMILDLVRKQTENFKQTLRVIKVWAKNRGISSNGMGYLGGISWAILVAKICQIFPNHKPAKLLSEFFLIYSLWNWKQMRVQLMKCDTVFSESMMCVVAPGSDYNSTERVNSVTFKVLCDEIRRGHQILSSKKDCSEVCRKYDFFGLFPIFMEIDICGVNKNKDDQKDFKDFQGFVESRVLRLIEKIIRFHKKEIEEGTFKVVPNPKLFRKIDPKYEFCSALFFGFELSHDVQINICKAVKEWCVALESSRTNKTLNVRVFECTKEELTDIEMVEPKKKREQKEDPRKRARKVDNI